MQAKEYTLDERGSNQPIQFNNPPENMPVEGDRLRPGATATLKLKGVRIDVDILDKEQGTALVGNIRGFEGHAGRDFKDLEVGDVLRFHPKHVFEITFGADQMPPMHS